jgi:hypothetical protein
MKYLKVLLLIAAIFMFVVACGDDDPINDLVEECANVRDCNGTAYDACCTPSQCKYVIGDEEFICNSTSDCTDAAIDATAYCNTL